MATTQLQPELETIGSTATRAMISFLLAMAAIESTLATVMTSSLPEMETTNCLAAGGTTSSLVAAEMIESMEDEVAMC